MWPELALLAVSAAANYFGGQKTQPTAPPAPSNYFGADGSFQVWNPQTNSYSTLGATPDPTALANSTQAQLLMNQMLGGSGYNTTRSALQSQIDQLKSQYVQGGNAQANTDILNRISELTSNMNNMKDVNTGYSPIGVSSPTDMLRYKGATDTVNQYLTDTLDQNYGKASAAQDQTMAQRGMGQSTMADWGKNQMAQQYATDKEGVAVQSENYYRQLQQQDEAAKLGILQGAESGLGSEAAIQQGQNQASQAQQSLAQQLASYNSNLQYQYSQAHDAWANQNNQNLYSSLAGAIKMGAGGYMGGAAGMLGMPVSTWGTGWGGNNYNPNRSGDSTTSSNNSSLFWSNDGSSSGGTGNNPWE